jgi:hypothetical protein
MKVWVAKSLMCLVISFILESQIDEIMSIIEGITGHLDRGGGATPIWGCGARTEKDRLTAEQG